MGLSISQIGHFERLRGIFVGDCFLFFSRPCSESEKGSKEGTNGRMSVRRSTMFAPERSRDRALEIVPPDPAVLKTLLAGEITSC